MKLVLPDVTTVNSVATINSNFDAIAQELQDKVLYRDNPTGEANTVQTDIDVNGKSLYNAGSVRTTALYIDGERVTPVGVTVVSGENNTSSNLGSGIGIAAPKSGVNLPFKSLVPGSGVSLQSSDNEITISAVVSATGLLQASNNLSDLSSASTAKSNLGLGNVNNTSDVNKPLSTATVSALAAKQDTLVSGTNIKTINGTSLLGAGNVVIAGGGGGQEDYVNVKYYGAGAVGDGVADDTAAIQAALTYCTTNGKTLFFPSGTYKITSGLTYNTGTSYDEFSTRCTIIGAGQATTRLMMPSGSFDLLTCGGFGAQRHVAISGLFLQGPGSTGGSALTGAEAGRGIVFLGASYFNITDVTMTGFDTGLYVQDTISGIFNNVTGSYNKHGAYLTGTIYTQANAFVFNGCKFGNNKNYGMWVDRGVCVSLVGGSVEANGITGTGAFVGGLYYATGGDGVVGLSCVGTYFEGNAGSADVSLQSSVNEASHAFIGCTFNRISSTNYVTNNIVVNTATGLKQRVSINGCGFKGFNTYTVDAGRKYITVSGSGDTRISWMGCLFSSSTESPTIENYVTAGERSDEWTTTANALRVTYTVSPGGTYPGGSHTATLALTGAPRPGNNGWVRISTDAIRAAGLTGIWVPGWIE